MIIIHGSRAFNYLDRNILKRSSKDYDFLGTNLDFNSFISSIKNSNKYRSIKIKPTSRDDKKFLVSTKKTGERLVVEFTFLNKDIEKPFKSDFSLYQKGVDGNGLIVTKKIESEFEIQVNLEFKTLDLNCLLEEKLSHVGIGSKEKYKIDMKNIESYLFKNKIETDSLDQEFISFKKLETKNYQMKKKGLNIDEFFDEFNIKRYIKHDTLHIYIGKYFKTGMGTYSKLVEKNGFSIKESVFLNLTKKEQFNLILEEVFVLTLERKILTRYVKMKDEKTHEEVIENLDKIFKKKFFEMYIYYTLHLKGIPKYIKTFVRENSNDLVFEAQSKIVEYNIMKTLPSSLFQIVYENYKNGVIVKNDY